MYNHTLLYILITWCDVPAGEIWASKSSAHRWLKRSEKDGTLKHLQGRILGIAQNQGLINWSYGAVDGSFSPGKNRGEDVAYGRKQSGFFYDFSNYGTYYRLTDDGLTQWDPNRRNTVSES